MQEVQEVRSARGDHYKREGGNIRCEAPSLPPPGVITGLPIRVQHCITECYIDVSAKIQSDGRKMIKVVPNCKSSAG